MDESRDVRIDDNQDEGRYELRVDGDLVGELLYRRRPGVIVLVHTEVDPALQRRGLGATLVRAALDDARSRGDRVVPSCPFVKAFIRRHAEYGDLLSGRA